MSAQQPARNGHESEDRNQVVVNDYADDLFSYEGIESNLIVVHLVYGGISDPGSIRRSALRARSCYLSELGERWKQQYNDSEPDSSKHKTEEDVKWAHGEVLRKHIRYLDRSNTFLNLIGRCLRDRQIDNLTFDLAVGTHESLSWCEVKESGSAIQFTYSKDFADTLVPHSLAEEYLNEFYCNHASANNQQESELVTSLWETKFLVSRADVFGKISDVEDQRKILAILHKKASVDTWSEPEIKLTFWNLLGELQSALLYFRGALSRVDTNEETAQSFAPEGKVFARQVYSSARGAGLKEIDLPTAVTILCPRVNDLPSVGIIQRLFIKLIEEEREQDRSNTICNKIMPTFESQAIKNNFRVNVKEGFQLSDQKRRLDCISLWMAWLVERLHRSIHEGHELDFWFVAGDQTEFRDNSNINFKELKVEQVKELAVPTYHFNEKEFENVVKRAAQTLEREHFPWFQRGRYALFWDIGRNSFAPAGLVAIKGSNWEQVLAESAKDKPNLDIPVCCVAYTTGMPKEAGVISHTKTNGGAFRLILRWRKTQWQSESDPRENHLLEQLAKLLDKTPEQLTDDEQGHLKDISALCIAVADNPHAGAILVILNEAYERQSEEYFHSLFAQMGKPWSLDNTREDRVALVSHDGATLLTLRDMKWGYRFLLSPDGVRAEVRNRLVECALSGSGEFPLTGAGSRRWSAALTAFKPEVRAVIAISQDGDIYYWTSKEGHLNEDAKCLHLPVAEDMELKSLSEICLP